MSPAEASASRGVSDPSVSMSRTSRSKSVDCSTRTGSMVKATRRTGEKIESTGMTPMVVERLLRSADDVAPAALDGHVDGQAALGVEGGDVEVGVEHLDVGRELEVAGGDVAGPALVAAQGHRPRRCATRRTMSFRLRMMSVTSSLTPGRVVNSWRASSKRTWVTAAPGMAESRVRRIELPSVWPKPGSRGPTANRWRFVLLLADGLDGRALDDEHPDRSCGGRWR